MIFLIAVLVAVGFPLVKHLTLVGGGFTSKTVCSGVFVTHRSVDTLMENELAGLSAMLFVPLVDQEQRTVTTTLLGMSTSMSVTLGLPVRVAAYLGPKFGCQLQVDPNAGYDFLGHREDPLFASAPGDEAATASSTAPLPLQTGPPAGTDSDEAAQFSRQQQCVGDVLRWQFTEHAYRANQTRATVVLHRGRVIGEGYETAHLRLSADSRLLGWSMTKSVFALVVGAAIQRGLLELDTPLLLLQMDDAHRAQLRELNGGRDVTFRNLLNMDDLLFVEEDYNLLKFIVQALFGTHDIAAFVLSNAGRPEGFALDRTLDRLGVRGAPTKPLASPHPDAGASFAWYYSSAVSNLLSRELRDRIGDDRVYWALPHAALFGPIGATSFAVEMDPGGTFVASSFSYASGRDWAKLGQLLLNGGEWGRVDGSSLRVLPAEFVAFLQRPHPASGGHYGAHVWLNPARVSVRQYNMISPTHRSKQQNAWMTSALPADAFYFSGFEGQNVFIVPSLDLVIARLGFTRSASDARVDLAGWNHSEYYGAISKCFGHV